MAPAAAVAAFQSILGGVANGNLTPSEASKLSVLVEGYRKALETEDFERRLNVLEAREA